MPSPTALVAHLRQSIANRGLFGTMRHTAIALYRRAVPPKLPPHPFDVEHGVDTGGILGPSRLAANHPNERYISAYWGTQPSVFRTAIERWHDTLDGMDPTAYSFLDIGCGKGRAVIMASEFPFRSILGIDLSQRLLDIAQRNLTTWQQRPHATRDIRVLREDALAVPLPGGPVLLYLYHPFGEQVLRPFVERLVELAKSRSTPIDMLYTNPELARVVLSAAPAVEILHEEEVAFTHEEAAADAFWGSRHRFLLYRFPGQAR